MKYELIDYIQEVLKRKDVYNLSDLTIDEIQQVINAIRIDIADAKLEQRTIDDRVQELEQFQSQLTSASH